MLFSPPAVTASKAVFGPVARHINAIGTLRPHDSVIIKSEVDSKIEKIHFSEGGLVEENDLLIELDDSIEKSQLMEAEAIYKKTKSELDPIEKLADKGAAARVQRDVKRAELAQCAAKINLHETRLKKHKIHAPFKGVIGLREISKGQFVTPGNELVKIVDCYPLKVDFKVAEKDISKVYVGQEILISMGGDDDQQFSAKIIAIDPESEKISHSFNVRAVLNIPEEVAISSISLKPGRFVSVKIPIDGDQQGILIPESSIEKVGEEDVVFRVVEGGIAIRTLITAGMRKDGNVEVITGINDGDWVITSGQSNVLDGKPVSVKNSESVSDVAKAVKELQKQQKAATQQNSIRK
ncbi:MAG: efflux RND transporter periplasmic adaptor subunit [Holosporaceae bacterium]|nr:efflux RND transporter periplasmic adaptor subunit [Holosporaceae bacterium]